MRKEAGAGITEDDWENNCNKFGPCGRFEAQVVSEQTDNKDNKISDVEANTCTLMRVQAGVPCVGYFMFKPKGIVFCVGPCSD